MELGDDDIYVQKLLAYRLHVRMRIVRVGNDQRLRELSNFRDPGREFLQDYRLRLQIQRFVIA